MTEIVFTRGIPGSGKSTWAKKWVEEKPSKRVMVSLDDLCMELFGEYVLLGADGKIDPKKEGEVMSQAYRRTEKAVLADKSVVFDAANLFLKNFNKYSRIAKKYEDKYGKALSFRTEDFPVSVEEALKRNSKREKFVPEEVIRSMVQRVGPKGEFRHIDGTYPVREIVLPKKREKAICFDMDGTLVDIRDVLHYLDRPAGRKDFDSFHRFSLHSKPNQSVVEQLMEAYRRGYKIVVTTARSEEYREMTQKWLEDYSIPYENVFMRKDGDSRPDYVVKTEIFHEFLNPYYDIVRSVDDNPQAVRAWRENGLSVTTVPFMSAENSQMYEGAELKVSEPLFREGVCIRCDEPIAKGFIDPNCAKVNHKA